jgi:hypothetical protein
LRPATRLGQPWFLPVNAASSSERLDRLDRYDRYDR